jgi:hypothetical protein
VATKASVRYELAGLTKRTCRLIAGEGPPNRLATHSIPPRATSTLTTIENNSQVSTNLLRGHSPAIHASTCRPTAAAASKPALSSGRSQHMRLHAASVGVWRG